MAGRFTVETVFKAVDQITKPVRKMTSSVTKFTRSAGRGFRKLNEGVSKLNASMMSGFKSAGLVVTGVLASVGFALNKVSADADALAKQSRRLDIPIEELQELRFVASQAGVGQELLNNSLGAFSKRLGEAKGGMGPLTSGLKKLNPQLLAQLNRTEDIGEAFDIVVNAMRDARTATEKAAIANAAFSRSGLRMVDISKMTADQIKRLRMEQRENGVVTMEQAEAAEAYNDSVDSLTRSVTGFLQTALVPLLPLLTEGVRNLREWVVANREIVTSRIGDFIANAGEHLRTFVDTAKQVGQFIAGWIAFSIAIKAVNAAVILVNATLAIGKAAMIAYSTVVGVLTAALPTLRAAILALNLAFAANPVGLVVKAVTALVALGAVLITAWEPVKKFFADLGDDIGSVIDRAVSAAQSVGGFFGFGDDEDERPAPASRVVSPQERTAAAVAENRTTSSAEVTIKDETGRAEVTSGQLGPGIQLQATGAF